MGIVAKEIKAMSLPDILAFEKSGEVTISGHCLKLNDIKVTSTCQIFRYIWLIGIFI